MTGASTASTATKPTNTEPRSEFLEKLRCPWWRRPTNAKWQIGLCSLVKMVKQNLLKSVEIIWTWWKNLGDLKVRSITPLQVCRAPKEQKAKCGEAAEERKKELDKRMTFMEKLPMPVNPLKAPHILFFVKHVYTEYPMLTSWRSEVKGWTHKR